MASTLASSKSPAVGNTRKRSRDVYVVVRIAQRCWAKFRKECPFALYSPFIVSLASGNLKVETFRQFVAQDVHLLNIFAHAFELAETYTQDEDEKDEINELRKTIINLHDSFVQEWDSDGFKDIALNPATSKFKDFLLATVSGKIDGVKATGELSTRSEKTKLLAYTLGAIASWMRFYAYIGNELKGFVDHNRYKKWIENYSSDNFQDFCLQTECLLNMLSDSFTKEELNIIERLYSQGIKHEIGFFLAQPLIQKAVVPLSGEHNLEECQLMIFSDFDFVFVGDHSHSILAGMATTPESDAIQTENPILRRNFISWRAIYDKYSEGYMQCIENMLATEKAENFNYEGLQKAFEPLSDILKHLNSEVMKAGVLKGLKLEDIKRTGESWFYQNVCMDFMDFFQALIKNESLNADVHVLSYCWCDELIRSTLSAGGLNGLKVHANELEFEESVCTGEILGKVVSPMDKVEAFGKT
nr:probable aminopyrimidine aminohydrolase, mitochondrial [Ipomoea batatas]